MERNNLYTSDGQDHCSSDRGGATTADGVVGIVMLMAGQLWSVGPSNCFEGRDERRCKIFFSALQEKGM